MSFNKLLARGIKRVPGLNRAVYSFSKRYIDIYRDYSYDFRQNGEEWLIKKAAQIFPGAAVIFDVGANKGAWAQSVKAYAKPAQIHCFEISPKTFANLKDALAGAPNVTLNNFGLSDKAGTINFRDYGVNHGGNTLIQNPCYVHNKPMEMVSASVMTGDDYCAERGVAQIDLLKIDVEGWEYFVLKGFARMFAERKVQVVQFEYGYNQADVHTLMKEFHEFFEGHGMQVGRLTPRGVDFAPFSHEWNDFKSGPNYVACLPHHYEDLTMRRV